MEILYFLDGANKDLGEFLKSSGDFKSVVIA